ncbi:probable ethanolamine kinase isoform X2 [Xenia sp. Carnegie-2017]|uniref:probable ethanolamine kinase isoform X2 n=1 Tax=Xenia sp. Carnegie-2017 TaxID=2897299 RepID=UPI001F04867B|nr:probable ethanolamine kinase isoform X2 [Xenia sp. Carnegie-2017]
MEGKIDLNLDKKIPFKNYEIIIKRNIHKIIPEWSDKELLFKEFTEGISNKLVGCRPQNSSDEDLVIFRLYGNQTELFIDRKQELLNVQFLYSKNMAPKLYATFENGYCHGFITGRTLGTKEMSDSHFSALIAKKLAHLHSIELPSNFRSNGPCVFNTIEKFLNALPERFPESVKQGRYETEILSQLNVANELEFLKERLKDCDTPLGYCHNDLLENNIIYTKEKDDVSFIDHEYGTYNYCVFDIGNHFNEFGGVVVDPDYSLYPDKEFQMKWLRMYVSEKAKIQGCDDLRSEEDIELLQAQVNKFSVVSHLLWGVWGLLQANFSTIDFDFLELLSSVAMMGQTSI